MLCPQHTQQGIMVCQSRGWEGLERPPLGRKEGGRALETKYELLSDFVLTTPFLRPSSTSGTKRSHALNAETTTHSNPHSAIQNSIQTSDGVILNRDSVRGREYTRPFFLPATMITHIISRHTHSTRKHRAAWQQAGTCCIRCSTTKHRAAWQQAGTCCIRCRWRSAHRAE